MTGASLRGVRLRLTAVSGAVLLVLLLVASGTLLWRFHAAQQAGLDDLATSRAQELVALLARERVPGSLDEIGDDSMAQVVGPDGAVVAASPNLGDAPAVSDVRPEGDEPRLLTLRGVPDDDETEEYRVWALAADSPDGRSVVYVGTSTEAVGESVRALAWPLAVGVPLLWLLGLLLLWGWSGRILRPVEEAQRRQRAFVADASHELQSPLASARSRLEVAGDGPGPEWPATRRALLGDVERLERLARDLLFLARLEDGPAPAPRLVDLDDVVLEEVARARGASEVRLDAAGVTAAPVRGHREDLARLVRNLLSNATRHAASLVRVTCGVEDGDVVLRVVDDGPGVPAEQRDLLFERFHRGEQGRGHGEGRSGLGLAIARAVAERHGGRVSLDPGAPGATFVVRLPAG
jgi:signal transduction histidine kinase